MSADGGRLGVVIRLSVRYGLISASLALLALIVFFYIGKHPFWIFPLFDIRIVLTIILLVVALREVREYHLAGYLYFWQGMTGSFAFVFTMASMGYAGVWLFGWIEPAFLTDYIAQGMKQLEALSPDALKEIGAPAVAELRKTLPETSLAWMARRYAVQTLVFGLFISVVISVVLRRQPQIDE